MGKIGGPARIIVNAPRGEPPSRRPKPRGRAPTDESTLYNRVTEHLAGHDTVKHTIENYFSVLKRGMRGVYQHCGEKHLHRYLAEFDFRYNNRSALGVDDGTRAEELAKGIVGKRLTYRLPRLASLGAYGDSVRGVGPFV